MPPFEEIVRLYQRDVRFYVARFLGRDTAADDVAQEVFVQVYRSLSQFSGRGSLKSWILGIARHLVGTWFRQQNRQIHFRAGDIELELVHCRWQEWQRETKSDVLSGFATPEVDT
ncbi:MAG: RNA polymerase sigma factor, partial [Planctomycetaceae bacterium]|nr:RNA polymerase sigma factor [Planctomycetaceae bacterium]